MQVILEKGDEIEVVGFANLDEIEPTDFSTVSVITLGGQLISNLEYRNGDFYDFGVPAFEVVTHWTYVDCYGWRIKKDE